ncbi:hypothetical protein HOY80DRAFT_1101552, partial [Tuber brumale]
VEVLSILSSFSTDNVTVCTKVGMLLLAVTHFCCLHCLCCFIAVSFSSHLHLSSAKTSSCSKRQAVSLLRCHQAVFPFAVI